MTKPIIMTDTQAACFNAKVDRSGGADACHPWTGGERRGVYGKHGVGSVKTDGYHTPRTHQIAYVLATGQQIPDGMVVRHAVCDNPPCCNPAHLLLGTDKDNSDDKTAKSRQARGSRIGTAALNEAQVQELKALYATGEWNQVSLSEKFGVSQSTISRVVSGRTWRHC